MVSGIKTMLGVLGIALSATGGSSFQRGRSEQIYKDLEVVNTEEVIREIDGVESEVTLVTVKNTGNKYVNPESVFAKSPDVKAAYSWEDNTGLNCLIDTNETFVFSISNYDKAGNILEHVSINAIEKDVNILWTRGISSYHTSFLEKENGDLDYTSMDVHFYVDENSPYKESKYTWYEISAQKGIAYYAIDGVSHTSYIDKDTLSIRSHDSLENMDLAILKIDYFFVSGFSIPKSDHSATGKFNVDLSPIFDVPVIVFGASILGAGVIVGAALISKNLIQKKNKKNSNS